MNAAAWRVTLAAAALMALVAGGRGAFGLFVSPLNGASGIGLANLSFALALAVVAGALVWPARAERSIVHTAPLSVSPRETAS